MSKLNIGKLKELQEQLHWEDKYDNDIQASPRFWVVMDYRWIPTWEGDSERISVCIPNYGEAYEINEFVNELLKNEEGEFNEEELELLDWFENDYGYDNTLEWIAKHIDEEAYLVPEREEEFIVPDTLFLTKKDAKEHIKKNKHHYSSKAHTYAMTGWRSKSYDLVWNMLMNIDWDKYDNS